MTDLVRYHRQRMMYLSLFGNNSCYGREIGTMMALKSHRTPWLELAWVKFTNILKRYFCFLVTNHMLGPTKGIALMIDGTQIITKYIILCSSPGTLALDRYLSKTIQRVVKYIIVIYPCMSMHAFVSCGQKTYLRGGEEKDKI